MRARDFVKYSRFHIPKFIGYVAENEKGEIAGGACVAWDEKNRPMLCLELGDEIRKRPIFVHRWAKTLIKAAIEACGSLYTIESIKEPTASKWLARLGFVPTGELINGERLLRHVDSRVP